MERDMSKARSETISFAVDPALRRSLVAKANAKGQTISELLREHHSGVAQVAGMNTGEYALHALRASFPFAPGHDESAALLRVVAESGTGDTGGLFPVEVVADLVKFVDSSRPAIVSAFAGNGPRAMPEKGRTFTRPKVTTFPTSGAQTEKAQLTSTQLITSANTLTKTTHGDVLNITEQDLDWSDESFFAGATEVLAEAYAIDTEATFTAAIAAQVTTNAVGCSDLTNLDAFAEAVAAAQLALIGSAGVPGDALYVGANQLANLTGATGQLAVPEMFPSVVYSPGFAHDFVAVAASRFMEAFETPKGLVLTTPDRMVNVGTADVLDLQAVPSTLERTLAYRGYFAANIYAEALCGIVAA
jgi:hypothetical protein